MGWQTAAYIVGTMLSVQSAMEAKSATNRQTRANEKIAKENKKIADVKAQRKRRELIRAQRTAESDLNVQSGGDNSGSKVQGVTASIGTGFAGEQGFLGQQMQANDSIFKQGLIASAASRDIASANAMGQFGSAISSFASNTNIWKTSSPPPPAPKGKGGKYP